MATINEKGRVTGGKVAYHAERGSEALRQLDREIARFGDTTTAAMCAHLAIEHARSAARSALNRSRRKKR